MAGNHRVNMEPEVVVSGMHGDRVRCFSVIMQGDHSHTYLPGQIVEGYVLLDLNRPIVARGISLQFCGQSSIYWTEKRRGGGAKCIETVMFDAHEEYFNIRHIIQEPGLLQAGENKYPFKFRLLPPLPENFEDNLCKIEYFIEARLKQDTNTLADLVYRKDIWISNPVDLNTIVLPDVTLPVHAQRTLMLGRCCCTSPPLVAFLRLLRSGYAPGETVNVQVDVENNSGRMIKTVKITLYEVRKYYTKYKTHSHRDVINSVSLGSVKPRATKHWASVAVVIPKQQIFNVEASNIFDIQHVLEMEVIPRTIRNKRVLLPLQLVVGAIPLSTTSKKSPAHLRLQSNKVDSNDRDTVSEFQRRINNPAPSKVFKGLESSQRQNEQTNENTRRRRKDRNRRVYPDDVIDTLGYLDGSLRTTA